MPLAADMSRGYLLMEYDSVLAECRILQLQSVDASSGVQSPAPDPG